ncbi:3-keto sterol reductase [Mycena polygramma]|nr:3-keto sterol reductase [Mycena polygramma]
MSGWPVVIVTGANAGVGFGICRRLLLQLCLSNPPDSEPQLWDKTTQDTRGSTEATRGDGLTLIMACRNCARLRIMMGHADVFRRNLKIEIEYLDLAVLNSQYPYVSHMILNAGQLATNFLDGITRPSFYVQSVGEVSVDGLGWIWQSNLFGHYSPASPKFYDNADWQLIKTDHSYESVKYQIDLIGTILDRRALQDSSSTKRIRHFVSHPGVCSTKISTNLVAYGGFLDTLKIVVFYIGRALLGSRHHSIIPANAAIAAVHLTLVSLSYITFYNFAGSKSSNGTAPAPDPVRFGAETDRWGHAEVGITPVREWKENEQIGQVLISQKKRRVSGVDS